MGERRNAVYWNYSGEKLSNQGTNEKKKIKQLFGAGSVEAIGGEH